MKTGLACLCAAAAGAAGVFGFAPFNAWPLVLVSLAALFLLWRHAASARAAFLIGGAWGLGLFIGGVSWIHVSLHVYGNMPLPLSLLATLLFCSYLALFPALAGALFAVACRRWPIGRTLGALGLAPGLFVLSEYARGTFLSGFPWMTVGYSQSPGGVLDAPLSGFAPLLGVHGLSLLLALTAGGLSLFASAPDRRRHARWTRVAFPVVLFATWGLGAALSRVEWSRDSGPPVAMTLVQGNIPQEIKWRQEAFDATLNAYRDLSARASGRVVVLPETALPGFLDQIPADYLAALRLDAESKQRHLLIGVPVAERDPGASHFRYFNSALSLDGGAPQRYDKRHLVAFGEFIPPLFSWVFRWLSIPLSDFTPGRSEVQPLDLGGLKLAVNICYEDAFGAEIAPVAASAHLLVNMSNMAWYGRSLAAEQHAQFSQMRALETSRWMLRATNTGLTAAIDPHGRIAARLPQFETGLLEAQAIPREGTTPYMRWGDAPALVLAALLVLLPALRAARGRG